MEEFPTEDVTAWQAVKVHMIAEKRRLTKSREYWAVESPAREKIFGMQMKMYDAEIAECDENIKRLGGQS